MQSDTSELKSVSGLESRLESLDRRLRRLDNVKLRHVAGEKATIETVGLIASGRLVKNANPVSYNLAPNDESGTGKDYVSRETLRAFVPKEYLVHRTRISPAVLTYWHNPKYEPDWTWDGKALLP